MKVLGVLNWRIVLPSRFCKVTFEWQTEHSGVRRRPGPQTPSDASVCQHKCLKLYRVLHPFLTADFYTTLKELNLERIEQFHFCKTHNWKYLEEVMKRMFMLILKWSFHLWEFYQKTSQSAWILSRPINKYNILSRPSKNTWKDKKVPWVFRKYC